MPTQQTYDKLFMNIAEEFSKLSTCALYNVGCVIVDSGRIISTGFNGTLSNTLHCNEKFDSRNLNREEHHKWSSVNEIHGELNVIDFAAKNYINVNGATLYSTMKPCQNCLKNILQAGIIRIIYKDDYDKFIMGETIETFIKNNNIKFEKLHEDLNKNLDKDMLEVLNTMDKIVGKKIRTMPKTGEFDKKLIDDAILEIENDTKSSLIKNNKVDYNILLKSRIAELLVRNYTNSKRASAYQDYYGKIDSITPNGEKLQVKSYEMYSFFIYPGFDKYSKDYNKWEKYLKEKSKISEEDFDEFKKFIFNNIECDFVYHIKVDLERKSFILWGITKKEDLIKYYELFKYSSSCKQIVIDGTILN